MAEDEKIIELVAVGLSTDLAEKAVAKGYTIEKLRSASKSTLSKEFETWEISSIIKTKRRKPIGIDIVNKLVNDLDWKCCMCWDSSKEQPVIIHHIVQHAKTGDDNMKILFCFV